MAQLPGVKNGSEVLFLLWKAFPTPAGSAFWGSHIASQHLSTLSLRISRDFCDLPGRSRKVIL